jgi:hypothetical protein
MSSEYFIINLKMRFCDFNEILVASNFLLILWEFIEFKCTVNLNGFNLLKIKDLIKNSFMHVQILF